MKKLLFISCVALLAACNNAGTTETKKDSTGTTVAGTDKPKFDYPYTLDKPYQNWQAGSQQNAVTALKALRDFETGDIASCVKNFADSVDIRLDNFRGMMSNDSLKTFFTAGRATTPTFTIKMDDWESVISEDKKEEWVTIWYKQSWTDKKGKADSLAVIDDCKMVNGKIAVLDEKIRHYPAAKK